MKINVNVCSYVCVHCGVVCIIIMITWSNVNAPKLVKVSVMTMWSLLVGVSIPEEEYMLKPYDSYE